MRRRLLWLFFPFLVPVLFAQTYTTVTASKVQDGSGNLLAQGSICFSPYNAAGALTAITPVGGSASTGPFCYTITAGAFTTVGATPQLPNLATASPSGLNYQATVYNQTAGLVLQVNWLTSLSGATVNWDQTVIPLSLNTLATSAGMGAPYLACAAGASFVSTTNTARPNWQCSVVNGYPQWFQSGSSPAPGPGQTATIPVVQAMINQALGGGSSIPAPGASGTAPVSNGSAYQTTSVLLGSARGAASGVAPLNASSQVPAANLPTCATGVNHGAGVVPDPGTTSTGKFLRDDCTFAAIPAGGSPGGATYSMQVNGPGSTFQGTGYKTDSTYSDIIGVRNLTGGYINSVFNPDLNGGMAALSISAACVGKQCTIQIPSTSTDPYALGAGSDNGLYYGILQKQARVIDNRNGMLTDYVEDPNSNLAHSFAVRNLHRLFNGADPLWPSSSGPTISGAVVTVFDAAPGNYDYGQESLGNGLVLDCNFYSKGIHACLNSEAYSYGTGDKVWQYTYWHYAGCGGGNGDDEHCEGWSHQMTEMDGSVPILTIHSLPGNNDMELDNVNAAQEMGTGRPMLRVKTAAGADAGVVAGCLVTALNAPAVAGQPPNFTVTGCTLPHSTAVGQMTAQVNTPRNLDYPISETFTVNVSSGSFVVGPACAVSTWRHEIATITAVTTSGSQQTITANLRNQYLDDRSGNHPWLFQGGISCTWGREVGGVFNTGNAGVGAMSMVFPILGTLSTTDTTHAMYLVPGGGFDQLLDRLYPYPVPVTVNANLTRSANVVTANVCNTDISYYAGAVIASTVDTSFNDASVTPTPATGMVGYCRNYTWSQNGANVTTPVAGTVTLGTGLNALSIYQGAEITNLVEPFSLSNPYSEGIGKYAQLEPNTIPWQVGDTVEVPFGEHIGANFGNDLQVGYMPNTTGKNLTCQGTSCVGARVGDGEGYNFYTFNQEGNLNQYFFQGGNFYLPQLFAVNGPIATYFYMGQNNQNWIGVAPQAVFINSPCLVPANYSNCTRPDGQWYLFKSDTRSYGQTGGADGDAQIMIDQYNNEIVARVGNNAGSINGFHIGDYGIEQDGGSAYFSVATMYLGSNHAGTLGNPTLDLRDYFNDHVIYNTGGSWAKNDLGGSGNYRIRADNNVELQSATITTGHCLTTGTYSADANALTSGDKLVGCVSSIQNSTSGASTGLDLTYNFAGINQDNPLPSVAAHTGFTIPTTAEVTAWNKTLPALQAVTSPLSLAVSTCGSTTVTIAGLTQTMDIHATAQVDPGAGTVINAYWTTPNIAKVEVCTPAAIAWTNVIMNVVATGN